MYWRIRPAAEAMTIPPAAPAVPPMPVTDATSLRGNISDTVVKRLADHPWCAAVARLKRPTQAHSLFRKATRKMGRTAHAQVSMADMRARVTDMPALRNGAG